jgi:TP901 family phage tail tape measure protein
MASERSVVVRIRAEIGDFRRQMDQAATAARDLGRATGESGQTTQTAMTQTQAAARDARAALNDAGKAAQEAARGFGLSYNSAGQLTDQFGNMVTEAHAAELGLETASEATREFAAQQAHAAAEAQVATTHMGRLAASARDHEQAWSTAGSTLLGFGAAVVAGVGLAIAKYAEFDKAMSEVQAATHETAGNMSLLREAAIAAGADTAFSAKEAADAISELSKAGVSTKDIMAGGLAGALSLAAAGSLGVADAAELAATAMTQFKLKGSDLPHVADLLAAGAGKAQGSVEDLGMALKQGGLVAAATGLSIEETTGGLAAFASAGLIGSDAGTSFKTMLQALTPSSKEAKAEMDRLGISAYDQQGKFIGLSKFAGVLQTSMRDMSDEQRAASQKIIFGSDAVRASNVLYEQGAQGIADWTDAVNESGFAASTAAIKQDNLAGDLEKLGGSFDTVLIQGGGGAAQALRGLVQGLEGMVDSLGKVKPEFLSLATGMAGVIGLTALLGGGFLTLVPKVMAAHAAFKTLQSTNAPLASGLGKVGKAAGLAMVAMLALGAIGAIFSEKHTTSAEEYANAIMKVSNAAKLGGAKSSDLDALFQSFDKFGGSSTVKDVNSLSDAITKLSKNDWQANVNQFFDGFTGMFNLPKSALGQLDAKLKGLGETLGDMASNGGAPAAAKTFNLLTEEFTKNGKGAQEALDKMPGYRDALYKLGTAAGVSLDKQELLELATGKIPAKMAAAQASTEGQAKAAEAQARMSEEAAKKLDEMGLAADGTVLSLSKLLEVMFNAGLIQLSANEAAIKYQESLENMDATFAKYGNNLNITTEGGKANQRAIDGMAAAGIANMKAMADNGASQEVLQVKLKGTYDSLIANYEKFGITGKAADDLARSALGIPKDVPIETSIQNFADTMAKAQAVKKGVEDIPGYKPITIEIFEKTWATRYSNSIEGVNHISNGPGGSGGLTEWDGGIVGFAGGGKVPGTPPASQYIDNVRAQTQNGTPYSIRSGEWIINEPQSKANDKWLRAINDGLVLDNVFGKYAAPSKSMAGGYGQTQSFSGYSAAANGGGGIAPALMLEFIAAAKTLRPITVQQMSTPRAQAMAVAREMEGF